MMFTLAYSLFATIFLFGLVAYLSEKKPIENALYILLGVFLILFAGLREVGVDQDSVAYFNYYNLDDDHLSLAAEPTFGFIANVMRRLSSTNGLRYLFLFYAIIGVTIKFIAIRRLTDLIWLTLIIYFPTYYLLHEFTQIRASVASGLLLLSIVFIIERKPYQFLMMIAIASTFHYSALLAFPIYFLSGDSLTRLNRVAIALAIPVGALIYYFKIDVVYIIPIELIRYKVQIYMEAESLRDLKLNVFNSVYIVKYIMLYVYLFFNKEISSHSKYFPIMLKLYALAMFSYLAFGFNATFAIRISELFGIVEIFLVPFLYYVIRPKYLAVLLISMLAIANLILALYQNELIQVSGFHYM